MGRKVVYCCDVCKNVVKEYKDFEEERIDHKMYEIEMPVLDEKYGLIWEYGELCEYCYNEIKNNMLATIAKIQNSIG